MKVKFEKRVGGWVFDIGGRSFLAIRNVAGFAHRDWEVWTLTEPTVGFRGEVIADQLGSRAECVAMAEGWYELNGPTPAERMYAALQVISKDSRVRGMLALIDPKALSQVENAITAYERAR